MSEVRVEDNFLAIGTRCLLAGYLASNVHRLGRPNIEPFFSYRQISMDAIDERHVRDVLVVVRHSVADYIAFFHGNGFWPDYTDLVLWKEGMDMNVHVDNDPPHFEHRDFSAVIYLNECEGGEIYFPDHDKEVAPEAGRLVYFPSGMPHGVRKITRGMRFTLAMWFTDDEKKWERPLK